MLSGDFHFYIFTSDSDINEKKLSNIKQDKWQDYGENAKVFYASKTQRSDRLLKEIKKQKPDVLFMIGIYSWHFTSVPLFFARVPVKILSVRGMLHTEALAQKSLKKNIFLAALRFLNVKQRCIFHATDESEAAYISEVFGRRARIEIAANIPTLYPAMGKTDKSPEKLVLISVCLISRMKNILAVLKALSYCQYSIVYHIIGPVKDEKYWDICNQYISQLPANVSVKYRGAMAHADVLPFLRASDVFIQVSESENFGHSMVEALSAGLPVITSFQTPWKDLQKNFAGFNTLIQEKDILEAIDHFAAMDNTQFEKWSQGASNFICANLSVADAILQTRKMLNGEGKI